MPVFYCDCGSKILVLPDIAAMNKAIKNHLIAHEKLTGKCLPEETLTQEILKVVSKGQVSSHFGFKTELTQGKLAVALILYDFIV